MEVRVMLDHGTQQSKGFGFVRYASQAEAEAAVSELSRVEVCGKEVTVRLSGDKYTLYLGGIDKALSRDDIIEALLSKGVEGLCDVSLQMDNNNPGRCATFSHLFTSKATRVASNSPSMLATRLLRIRILPRRSDTTRR